MEQQTRKVISDAGLTLLTLSCSGVSIYVHKPIMAAVSLVFTIISVMNLWHSFDPWREDKMILSTLRNMGGRLTYDELHDALERLIGGTSIYDDERVEDMMSIGIDRLQQTRLITVDNDVVSIV